MFAVDCSLNVRQPGKIYQSSFITSDDGSDSLHLSSLPLANLRNPVAVDYDPYEEMIYWTDYTDHSISRAHLNGSHQEILVQDLGREYIAICLIIFVTVVVSQLQ